MNIQEILKQEIDNELAIIQEINAIEGLDEQSKQAILVRTHASIRQQLSIIELVRVSVKTVSHFGFIRSLHNLLFPQLSFYPN